MPPVALAALLAQAAATACGDPVACALVLIGRVLRCLVLHDC